MPKIINEKLMVGSKVYQVLFSDDIEDIVLMSSLSKERIDNFVQTVRDYDAGFVKGSEHDLDGSYEANHPLSSWRDELVGGGSLTESVIGSSWVEFFTYSEFTLE